MDTISLTFSFKTLSSKWKSDVAKYVRPNASHKLFTPSFQTRSDQLTCSTLWARLAPSFATNARPTKTPRVQYNSQARATQGLGEVNDGCNNGRRLEGAGGIANDSAEQNHGTGRPGGSEGDSFAEPEAASCGDLRVGRTSGLPEAS
eukprot:6678773-Prymnesium_polylepis.1